MSYHANKPTIRSRATLVVAEEIDNLRKAMKGLGTDEAAIIKVLTSCSNAQRQMIQQHYNRTYERDLMKDLKKELSGDLEDVIVALMTPSREYLAKELKHALKSKDGAAVVEIIFGSEPHVLQEIRKAYGQQNDDSLEEDIDDETKGVFEDVLVATVTKQRGNICSEGVSGMVARALYNNGDGLDNEQVIKAFSTLSFEQLKSVFVEYYRLASRSLGEAFDLEYEGKAKTNMHALYQCVENRYAFLAASLHNALSGLGTNERDLTRLIVSRSEIDLGNIKDEYYKMYDSTLENAVKGDTVGDYRKVLLALLQNNY